MKLVVCEGVRVAVAACVPDWLGESVCEGVCVRLGAVTAGWSTRKVKQPRVPAHVSPMSCAVNDPGSE